MITENDLKKFEIHCKSLPDHELEYLNRINKDGEYLKVILKEIIRRQETKEQDVRNDNKKIKKYTVIILWLTVAAVIIGIFSFIFSLISSSH